MTIYQIVGDIKALSQLIESLTDEETGETRQLSDEEKAQFVEWINEQSEAFDDKFDRICKFYRNLKATSEVCNAERDAMKAESDRLSKRAKARENEAKRVNELVFYALDALGKQKHKTDLFSAGIQNTGASVRIGDSAHSEKDIAENLPDAFVTREVSKASIVDGIKAGTLYIKPVSGNIDEIKKGSAVSPLDEGAVFGKIDGFEYRLEGIKYLSGKICVIR